MRPMSSWPKSACTVDLAWLGGGPGPGAARRPARDLRSAGYFFTRGHFCISTVGKASAAGIFFTTL
jgi:hypothetical protein